VAWKVTRQLYKRALQPSPERGPSGVVGLAARLAVVELGQPRPGLAQGDRQIEDLLGPLTLEGRVPLRPVEDEDGRLLEPDEAPFVDRLALDERPVRRDVVGRAGLRHRGQRNGGTTVPAHRAVTGRPGSWQVNLVAMGNGQPKHAGAPAATSRRLGPVVLVAVMGLALAACSLHISKNGVSGNILGHKFSAAEHALPQGFPSDVPLPDNSRVLGGGGTSVKNGEGWDALFAVTGSGSSVMSAYQSKLKGAGYTITDVQNPQTFSTPTSSGGGGTSTTQTVNVGSFTATNSQWTIKVLVGTTSGTGGELKPGEVGLNITLVPTSDVTSTT